MKQWITFCVVSILFILGCSRDKTPLKPQVKQPPIEQPTNNQYYYYNRQGEKVRLEKSFTLFSVRFPVEMEKIEGQVESYCAWRRVGIAEKLPLEDIYIVEMKLNEDIDSLVKGFGADTANVEFAASLFYEKDTGQRFILTDKFIVGIKENRFALYELNREMGTKERCHSGLLEGIEEYLLQVTNWRGLNALKMATLYHQRPFIKYAIPIEAVHDEFYYYNPRAVDKRVYGILSPNCFSARFQDGLSEQEITTFNAQHGVTIDRILDRRFNLWSLRVSIGEDIFTVIEQYNRDPRVVFATPSFYIDGLHCYLTDEFIVRFKSGVTEQMIETLNAENYVKILRYGGDFLLQVTPESRLNSLEMSNFYFKNPLVEWAHPNWLFNPHRNE